MLVGKMKSWAQLYTIYTLDDIGNEKHHKNKSGGRTMFKVIKKHTPLPPMTLLLEYSDIP